MDNEQLKRIADAIEEILRLVKKDQEDEQEARITNGQDLSWPLAMAPGPRTKLQASSSKRQAPSSKLDKKTLQ